MCGTTLERRHTPDTELPIEDAEQPFASLLDVAEQRDFESVLTAPAVVEPVHAGYANAAMELPKIRTEMPSGARSDYGSFMGQPMDASAARVTDEVPFASEPAHAPSGGLTGPSFLGLSEDPGREADYLLDDDRPRSHWRAWLMLFVVGALAALGYAQWRANQRGTTLFAGLPAIQAPRPPKKVADTTPANPNATSASKPEMTVEPTNEKLKAETEAAKAANQQKDQQKKAEEAKANPPAAASKTAEESTQPEAAQDQKGKNAELAANKSGSTDKTADTTADDENADEPSAADASKAAKAEPELSEAPATANKRTANLTRSKETVSDVQDNADRDLLLRGRKYLYGQGVAKSCPQALTFIHAAANRGSAEARAQLAGMYATGNCAPFDRVLAYRWFSMALSSAPRNSLFQRNRDMLWREMSDQERQRARDSLD